MTTPPDTPNIADLNLPALLRRVKIALPLGLVLFVAGAVVIATGPLGLGVALLVVGILCPAVAIALLLAASRRTKEFTREMQSRQQATTATWNARCGITSSGIKGGTDRACRRAGPYSAGTVTATRFPSPALSRQRPWRAGWLSTPCVSRTPTRSPSGRVRGPVRQPRRARLASTCQPEKPTQMLSASPANTSARPESPPNEMILLSSMLASQSLSISASSMSTAHRRPAFASAAANSSSSRLSPSKRATAPSKPASARSGDGRGAARITGVAAARNDRAMAARIVDLPDLGGPATMNAGKPSPRSGPRAVSSSPPTRLRLAFEDELLWRDLLKGAHATGDEEVLRAVVSEISARAALDEVLPRLSPETEALIDELLPSWRSSAA